MVVANDYQNQDLFWALRGGGGGTFGVVVSVTLKTFPEPPVIVTNANVTFPDYNSMGVYLEAYLKSLPATAGAGGSGYWYVDPLGYILQNGKPTMIFVHFFFGKTDITPINAIWDPLYNIAKGINGTTIVNQTLTLPQARLVLPKPGGSDSTGTNAVLGSRLYSQANLETPNGASKIVNALQAILTKYPTIIEGHLTAGGKVADNADKVDSALNPSWRRALGQIIIPVGWNDSTPVATQQQMTATLTDVLVPILAAVEPSMGAYTNEANAYEPEWQSVFWQSNYPRLLEVKNKWDPRGLFRCNRCVGSERWDSSGNCPAK